MKDRTQQPAYALHAVVTVLDRAADQILKEQLGTTYSRFLTLLTLQRLGRPPSASSQPSWGQ